MCSCRKVEKKPISRLLQDNGNLSVQTIRDLRSENERFGGGELNRQDSVAGSVFRPPKTTDNDRTTRFPIEITPRWERHYEELKRRHAMLSGETRLLEEEKEALKKQIGDLEKRQASYKPIQEEHGQNDKQCEVLKTQIAVCMQAMQAMQAGIFESERRSRETIRKEKEKLKRKLEEAQEFIKRLTTELDARNGTSKGGRSGAKMTSIRDENGYMGGRTALPVQETRHV